MGDVTPGQKILPNMTAAWYNKVSRGLPKELGTDSFEEKQHQNIIRAIGTEDLFDGKVRLDPIGLDDFLEPSERFTYDLSLEEGEKDSWGVLLDIGTEAKTVEVVIAGVTLANVEILEGWHRYVTYNKFADRLESNFAGRAEILVVNPQGPSLINIGGVEGPMVLVGGRVTQVNERDNLYSPVTIEIETIGNYTFNEIIGQSIKVHDPFDEFPKITLNSFVRAYYDYEIRDWVIINVSPPIDKVRIKLTQGDLLSLGGPYEEEIDILDGVYTGFVRIPYTQLDKDEKDSLRDDRFLTIEFENPRELNAVKDSFVIIEKNYFGVPDDVLYRWEVTAVEKQIAKWVKFTKIAVGISPPSEEYVVVKHWEGDLPEEIQIVWEVGDEDCLDLGDQFICCYNPEENTYVPVSTASALLGEPVLQQPVTEIEALDCKRLLYKRKRYLAFEPCDNNPDPDPIIITLPTVNASVLVGATLSANGLCFQSATVEVCSVYLGPNICIPVVPCEVTEADCSGAEATYTWRADTQVWELTTPCPGDPANCASTPPAADGTVDGETQQRNCVVI